MRSDSPTAGRPPALDPLLRAVRAAAVAWGLLASALAGTAAARAAEEEGAAAPLDGWVTEGGCASRTALGRSRPLDGPVETAWTQTLPGPIVGEPLVTGSLVVLDVAAPAGQHTLSVHQLAGGRAVARRSIRTADPLLASIVGGFVVVRSGPQKLGAYRIRGTQLVELWNQDVGAPVESMVAHGGAVYVRSSSSLTRWEIGAREATWSARVMQPRGRLAARGGHVYVLDYDRDGNGSLVAIDRRDGRVATVADVGHHDGAVPGPADDPEIVVGEREVFVLHRLGVPTKSGRPANMSSVERRVLPDGTAMLSDGGLRFARDVPFCLGPRWLLGMDGKEGPILFEGVAGSDEGRVLATGKVHPEWLDGMRRASSAGGVLYHPQGALDLATSRILWTPEVPWTRRPVTARGTLLLVEGGTVLRALRERGGGTASAPVDVGPGPGAAAAPGRAVLRDGSIVAGPIRRGEGGALLVEGTPPRTIAAEDLLLVEDASGKILRAAPGDDLAEAIDAIADERIGAAAGKVLVDALVSRDAALLRRLLGEAVLRGAPPSDVEKAEKRIRDLLRPNRPLPADPAAAAAADRRLAETASIPRDVASQRLKALPADAPADVQTALLRTMLRHDRADAEAAARVRALLPPGMTPGEPFDARDWLDFADAVRTTPVEVIRPVPANHPGITPAQRSVSLLAMQWREDVVGLKSRQLLVITPVKRPGAIARCLALGELVCSTLEKLFEKGTRKRATREPLTLVLYPSKAEFEKESSKRGHTDVAWTAGFYSPSEELSRLFLPEDDEEFQEAIGTFAHELTHQWIDERCPTFGNVDAKSNARTPGYWIVEGFATLVEELILDPRRGTWAFDPWNASLEVVAVGDPLKLHRWDRLLAWSHADFANLPHEKQLDAPLLRRLGYHQEVSSSRLFYDQAAAVCCWLFQAEDGARREKLLDYLTAHYRGEPPPIEEAFGMTAAQLGERVRVWARERAMGPR